MVSWLRVLGSRVSDAGGFVEFGGGGGSRLGAFIKMQSPGVQGYVDSYFGLWVRWRPP